jgi:hypothetical protein
MRKGGRAQQAAVTRKSGRSSAGPSAGYALIRILDASGAVIQSFNLLIP